MLTLTPFPAIRFDFDRFDGDLSHLIAPPYDVLNQADKAELLARDARNIVAIDLPHLPPKSAGPPEAYERAARTLDDWVRDGVLVREQVPSIYIYHQVFEHGGRTLTRRMFIARLRLEPLDEGVILPHEKTFGGPKEDRLALMKATGCQLSPIFALFSDPDDAVGRAFGEATGRSPDATGTLDGVNNKLWIESDRRVMDAVASTMTQRRVYIADGHHRYGTAGLYRDWLAQKKGEALDGDHPANTVMFVLASMDDPGCLILPYHRAIGEVDLSMVVAAWSPGTAPCDRSSADIVLLDAAGGRETPLRYTNRKVLRELEPAECDPWYELDYAYLHRYLIDELLAGKLGVPPKVYYAKSENDARQAAGSGRGVALLVKATPMAHLRAVSEAGGLMPQKSTCFHPKLATGLTINPLS